MTPSRGPQPPDTDDPTPASGGLDIPSELEVGDSIERGLSFEQGGEASIVLRGNFPTVTVPLPIGGS